MTAVQIAELAMWTASVAAAAWKLTQLVRSPGDRDLRAVTGCTVLVALALSAQLTTQVWPAANTTIGQSSKLVQNVLLVVFFSLLLSLLASARTIAVPGTDGSGYREPALAGATGIALVIAFLATEPAGRGAAYGASDDPGVLAFYLVGNLYMLYATTTGARLTWSAARFLRSRAVRVSLRIAGGGLVVCALGCHLPRGIETAGQLITGVEVLPDPEVWTPPALASGIVVFSAGLLYPGARSGVLRLRLHLRRRRQYRRLAPLWGLVATAFPALILLPEAGRVGPALLGPSPLRYYRRLLECRDGLTEIASWLAEPVPDGATPADQAQRIRAAVQRRRGRAHGSEPPSPTPISVLAPPAADGTIADTAALLVLADALREGPGPGRSGRAP